MDKKLVDLLEDQINKELWSAYLYYDIAEYYQAKSLDGYHKHFEAQAKEEIEHAEKIAEFLHDRDIPFSMKAIAAPSEKFNDLREPLVFQLEHEKLVTSLIHNIYNEAVKLNDLAVKNFMEWFISEQVEEEKHSKEMIDKFDLYGKDGSGLYHLNKELSK